LATAKAGIKLLHASGAYRGYWEAWRGPLFEFGERLGIHALPVHYYTPIPTQLDHSSATRANSMAGVELDVGAAAARASNLISSYTDALEPLLSGTGPYDPLNPAFHPLDAALLYARILEAKPRRIIEIGSGNSTFVIAQAVRDMAASGEMPHVTCIEPFLPDYLKPKPPEIAEIIEEGLQGVSLQLFKSLEANDILFIDSTHVVRFNSDVVFEILEILPILQPGVIVHFHDIFLPDDYPAEWLEKFRFFWAEQYMLQAFLSMNPNYAIDLPAHSIRKHLSSPASDLIEASGSTVYPGSLWLNRI
jgi:predicted O-methyltransferase YrrM